MSRENLKEQLDAIEKHLKWCIDNNKPQEQLDVHTGVISDIKQEIETKMMSKEFKPKRNLKERYSLEGIAKSKGIAVDELKNQIKTNQEERKKILDKYIKKGMTTEQANRMTMLELYIPGFTGPTFKD